jgi:hypothetical protein
MTQPVVGVIGRVYVDSTNTQNWNHNISAVGVEGSISTIINSSGTISNASSFLARGLISANSARITNLFQINIEGLTSSTLQDTVDNAYGIIIGSIDGAITSNFAIKTNNGKVQFGDNTSVTGTNKYFTVDATKHLSIASFTSGVNIFWDESSNITLRTQPAADVNTTNNLTTRFSFGNTGTLTITNDLTVSGDSINATSATLYSSAIKTTGLSTFGTNVGDVTIPAGSIKKVYVAGLTTATGKATVSYKSSTFFTPDTIPIYWIQANDTLGILAKYNKVVTYLIGSK